MRLWQAVTPDYIWTIVWFNLSAGMRQLVRRHARLMDPLHAPPFEAFEVERGRWLQPSIDHWVLPISLLAAIWLMYSCQEHETTHVVKPRTCGGITE